MRSKALSVLAAAALTTTLAHAAPVHHHDADVPTGLEPAADPVCCPARSFLHEVVPTPDNDQTQATEPDPQSISEFSPPPSTPLTTDLPPFVAPPCGTVFLPAYDISGDAVGSPASSHSAPAPSPHAAAAMMIIPPIVPEPASATLLAIGGIVLMHRRRVLRE